MGSTIWSAAGGAWLASPLENAWAHDGSAVLPSQENFRNGPTQAVRISMAPAAAPSKAANTLPATDEASDVDSSMKRSPQVTPALHDAADAVAWRAALESDGYVVL